MITSGRLLAAPGTPVAGKAWKNPQLVLQVGQIVLVWVFLCVLHWNSDGLWFQPDSGVHALNGVFWRDYLGHLGANPVKYALNYYSHYPGIDPASYPPVFYFAEAVVYSVFGVNPFASKGLVLVFSLVTALYLAAWIRRWIGAEFGGFGALVMLVPMVATYSHAVMLNVPSLALVTATLYHTRRWLEAPESNQIYLAAFLGLLSILCYYFSGVLVFVWLAWLIYLGKFRLFLNPRSIVLLLVCVALLLPGTLIFLKWSALRIQHFQPGVLKEAGRTSYLFYLKSLPETFGVILLGLAFFGAIIGLIRRTHRHETIMCLLWVNAWYLVLGFLKGHDARYLLPLAIPFLGLAVIGSGVLVGSGDPASRWTRPAVVVALGCAMGYQAQKVQLPGTHRFKEVTAFLDQVAPGEPIFYDGSHWGAFMFFLRAEDPQLHRRVVRSDKLLYLRLNRFQKENFVHTPEEVVERLRTSSGCRWLAIVNDRENPRPQAAVLLREAIKGPEFRLVRSFPIFEHSEDTLDFYQILIPVVPNPAISIPLPMVGKEYRLESS